MKNLKISTAFLNCIFQMLSMTSLSFPLLTSHADSTPCLNGLSGNYPCLNVEWVSEISLIGTGLRTPPVQRPDSGPGGNYGSGVWGWTDKIHGREYALMGLNNKLSVVDITDPIKPHHLADMPTQTVASLWREVSVVGNYAIVVSEAMGHGMQVLDLKQLDELDRNQVHILAPSAYYSNFGSAHTVFGQTATRYAYAMGSDTCDAGVHVVNMKDALNPIFTTCLDRRSFSPKPLNWIESLFEGKPNFKTMDAVYTHDMVCVVYHGPDDDYFNHEICVASNDNSLNIIDVTDKVNPRLVAITSHPDYGFVHQGWFTEDQRFFAVNDEMDEIINDKNMVTYFYDFSDLDQPKLFTTFDHGVKNIDHNHYVKGRYLYQANYLEGLTVLDLNRLVDGKVSLAGKFDTTPTRAGVEFGGIWNVYPYFESGNVILSSIDDGKLYIVKPHLE